MNKPDLTEDWLAGNAVVAFVGALLMAQTLRPSDGDSELPFNAPALASPEFVTSSIVVLLFVLSFALALSSLAPPLRLWALRHASPLFSPLLAVLTWAAFTLGLSGAISGLPWDRWWPPVLFLGGIAFFFFLGYRAVRAFSTRAER